MQNTNIFKQIAVIIFFVGNFNSVIAGELDSITFEWQWTAGNSDYSSGPDGDIAFDLYMRTNDDAGYDFEYPTIAGIEDCSFDGGLYRCQATLAHAFEPGIHYFFTVAACLVDDPESVCTFSNEIEYTVDNSGSFNESDSNTFNTSFNVNSSALYSGQNAANAGSSTTGEGGTGGSAGGCFIEIGLTK